MFIYYLVVVTSAIIFFLFLVWLRKYYPGLSFKLIGTLVLWVLMVSLFLPGIISFVPPVLVFIGVFPLVLCGGYIIFKKLSVNELWLEEVDSEDTFSEEIVSDEIKEVFIPEITGIAEEIAMETAEEIAKEITEEIEAEIAEAIEKEIAAEAADEEEVAEEEEEVAAATEAAAASWPETAPEPASHVFPKGLKLIPSFLTKQLFPLSPGCIEKDEEVSLLTEQGQSFGQLINSAFLAKEEQNYVLSAEKFKAALSMTEDVSFKSMIYTEFVFLYKEMGKYLEAADLIGKFLSENGSSLSSSLRIHFEKEIKYLQTIDELLKKAEHPDPAFSQIPSLIKIRAEKIFQE